MKQKRKQRILCVATACIVLAGITGYGCTRADTKENTSEPAAILPVKAICLQPLDHKAERRFPATAKATREVDLAFRVSGPLVALNADTGDRVTRGQVLARIDPRDFMVQVNTLEAALQASRANLTETRLQFDRYAQLLKVDAAAKATYDEVKAAWEVASATVKMDQKKLEDARNALKDTTLKAPFTGYINLEHVENYETVTVGQPIVSLVDMSVMEVMVGLPEDLVGEIPRFTGYTCRFDAVPDRHFPARFKEVGKRPGQSNQTYPLTLILEGEGLDLIRDGMSGQVTISTAASPGAKMFHVPARAVISIAGEGTFVWVVDTKTNRADKRRVTPCGLTPRGLEIRGDISPGDWVVTSGASFVGPNERLKVLAPASPTNVGNEL